MTWALVSFAMPMLAMGVCPAADKVDHAVEEYLAVFGGGRK